MFYKKIFHASVLLSSLLYSLNSYAEPFIPCPEKEFIKENAYAIDKVVEDSSGIYLASSSTYAIEFEKKLWRLEVSPVFAHNERDALVVGQDNAAHVKLKKRKYAIRMDNFHVCSYMGREPVVEVQILTPV